MILRAVTITVLMSLVSLTLGCRVAYERQEVMGSAISPEEMALGALRIENIGVSTEPTPEDVDALAASTQRLINTLLADGARRETWLGMSIGIGTTVVKLGQYAGGGGALVFGLNAAAQDGNTQSGRNAAYSGAVAAGVTALEDLFGLEKARNRATGCRNLRISQAELISRTHGWVYQRNDPAFRRRLKGEHEQTMADATTLYRTCVEK
ncbi:MAG: hypothetical protein H0W42_03215 [Gemmatimonadaceae bacterium]|nr:hypothetical protein [Gemmatimonadaceae bacterium]